MDMKNEDKINYVDNLFCAVYEDDGPNGLCCQSMYITCPWKRLFLFEAEDKLKEFCELVKNDRSRTNGRITYIYYPKDLGNREINLVLE